MKRLGPWCLLAAALSSCDSPPLPPLPPSASQSGQAPSATAAETATAARGDMPVVIKPGGTSEAAVGASNEFAFDLWGKLRPAGNLAVSPASISVALAMTYAGAKGETASQMAQVLHLPADGATLHGGWATLLARWEKTSSGSAADGGPPPTEIAVANRLFGERRYRFEPSFLALTRERYGAPLERREFAKAPDVQRRYINDWVKGRTRDRIVDLIPPHGIDDQTRLVLTNAIYFKAQWTSPFAKAATKDDTFTTGAAAKVTVPMMRRTVPARYAEHSDAQLVELPYRQGPFAMVVALPKEGTELASLEAKLSAATWSAWSGALKRASVAVTLPRFKLEPGKAIELSKTLSKMGMPLAFTPGKADFTALANPPAPADRLHISKVFHKAFVAVDEAGTEAAAATAVVMTRAGGKPAKPKEFRADRPFLFFIVDKQSSLVLFVGRVDDPSA